MQGEHDDPRVVSLPIDNYWLTTGGVVIIPHQYTNIPAHFEPKLVR